METITINLTQLRSMIGQRVVYQEQLCVVIEVLESDTQLVLQIEEHQTIQPDQFGDARRVVPETITIPVLSADKTELHACFLALDLIEIDAED